MRINMYKSPLLFVCLITIGLLSSAQQASGIKKMLKQEFKLTPQHSKDTQYYEMISRLQPHSLDGTPQGWDVYHLILRCVPSKDPSKGDEYTCLRFTVAINNKPEVGIPTLTNWKYYFSLTPNARDDRGYVFGIDHAKFEKLSDANGNMVPVGNTYHVYNAFIDFHSMILFSERSAGGKGVQDLKWIGDKVQHAAAFSEAPVNLGAQVAEGSYFKNGEITLAFKGLSIENDKTCAILEYDSGESSFYMKMKPTPTSEIPTKGSSHYWGDIFKDISGGWIQKATLHEMVVSETTIPGMTNKVNMVVERSIEIRNVKSSQANKP
jgi:hypothetical protein